MKTVDRSVRTGIRCSNRSRPNHAVSFLSLFLDAPPDQPVPLPESAAMPNCPPDPDVLCVELYHAHLPMLAEMGFITWETDPLVASRGPQFDEVAVVLDALHSMAASIPDSLVVGCQRLVQEQQDNIDF